ncbi:putative HORMA domain-containing protein [Helianthus anomalus]
MIRLEIVNLMCSILYNRGVYSKESFGRVKKLGLPLLLFQGEGVKVFIANLNAQLSGNLI